jgi:hypothetical protein
MSEEDAAPFRIRAVRNGMPRNRLSRSDSGDHDNTAASDWRNNHVPAQMQHLRTPFLTSTSKTTEPRLHHPRAISSSPVDFLRPKASAIIAVSAPDGRLPIRNCAAVFLTGPRIQIALR